MESEEAADAIVVPGELRGCRLDVALARLFPGRTRSQCQTALRSGGVRVLGEIQQRPAFLLVGGEEITVSWPRIAAEEPLHPCEIPLDVLWEDEELLAINKPPGLVVHPGAGNRQGTLAFSRNKFFDKLGIGSLGLMFTGYNLWTLSKMNLQDPEAKSSSSSGTYPLVKTYNLAINITF